MECILSYSMVISKFSSGTFCYWLHLATIVISSLWKHWIYFQRLFLFIALIQVNFKQKVG